MDRFFGPVFHKKRLYLPFWSQALIQDITCSTSLNLLLEMTVWVHVTILNPQLQIAVKLFHVSNLANQ